MPEDQSELRTGQSPTTEEKTTTGGTPPIKIPPLGVGQAVKTVEGKVHELIDKVENPTDLTARSTFGYHPTAGEQQQKAMLWSLLEKGWWGLALLVVALILIFNWSHLSAFYCLLTNCNPAIVEPEPTLISTPAPTVIASTFSGRAAALTQDLGWIRADFFSQITYYQAGEVISGGYAGAKRYFAATSRRTDQVFRVYEFYQLAGGEVVLVGGRPNMRLWLQNMEDYYLGQYFADTVRFQDEIPDDFPQIITVSPTMRLYRREVLTELGPYDCNVYNGEYFDCYYYGRPELALSLSPTMYHKLDSLEAKIYQSLSFYSKAYSPEERESQIASNLQPEDYHLADQYILGGSKIIVQDSAGVNMIYELVFVDQWEHYARNSLNNDLRNLNYYRQELMTYTMTSDFSAYKQRLLAGSAGEMPAGKPETPVVDYGLPGFVFTNKQFQLNSDQTARYTFYIGAFSSICSTLIDGKVMQNIKLDELEEIGRVAVPQVPLYRLKDSQHQLNRMLYNLKIGQPKIDGSEYRRVNQDRLVQINGYDARTIDRIEQGRMEIELPSMEEYLATNPLLFIIDPWGRPTAIWEADLEFLANCVTIEEDSNSERVRAY